MKPNETVKQRMDRDLQRGSLACRRVKIPSEIIFSSSKRKDLSLELKGRTAAAARRETSLSSKTGVAFDQASGDVKCLGTFFA